MFTYKILLYKIVKCDERIVGTVEYFKITFTFSIIIISF